MSKSKKLDVKVNVDQIKVGPFKAVKYYEAPIEGPDNWMQTFVDIGRQVITEDQYRNIGFNHVLKNAVKNEFKLESLKKTKKKK
jgi:hypothetical protein